MRYCDDTVAKALTEKQIALYERLLSYIPAIEEVVKKFDGKVLNKRFDTELKKVYSGARCSKAPYSEDWLITISEWNDRYVSTERGCVYVASAELCLAHTIFGKWLVGGRIVAEKLIKEIEANAESYKNHIAEMKEQLAHIDDLLAEYDKIIAAREAFGKKVNPYIKQYFEFKF